MGHELIWRLKYVSAGVTRLEMPLPLVGDRLEADAARTDSATGSTRVLSLLVVIIVRGVAHIEMLHRQESCDNLN